MTTENILTRKSLNKKQFENNCVFSTCDQYPPTSKGLQPQNCSLEQLDQFYLEDNAPEKPLKPKSLKSVGKLKSLKYKTPLTGTKIKAVSLEKISPLQMQTPALPLQQPQQQETLIQQQLYSQQANAYTAPISIMQPAPIISYNAPVTKPKMTMTPIAYSLPMDFPQMNALKCPHCNNIVSVESLIPVLNEPAVVECCSPAVNSCCQLATCTSDPANPEELYSQAGFPSQYERVMQISQFQTEQLCSKNHKPELIANPCNLPESSRAFTKNLNSVSTSSQSSLHEISVCQCTQQQNSNVRSNKSAYHRKEMSDVDSDETIDNSELFLNYLRKLTLNSQKLLDTFENAMDRKNISKPIIKKSSRIIGGEETECDERNVRLDPIKVTVPLKLTFLK